MHEHRPSLLCRSGVHRWNADPNQGQDELGETRDCYCGQCHVDRYDERYLPTTRLNGWVDAIRTPFAKLRRRIATRLHPAPPPRRVDPRPEPRINVMMPAAARQDPAPGTPRCSRSSTPGTGQAKMTLPSLKQDEAMNSVLDRCPPLPDHLVLGKHYRRPCVRAVWKTSKPRWVPVIGSMHTDPEHVKADFLHVHVDYRFLTDPARTALIEDLERSNSVFRVNPVHSMPVSTVRPQHLEYQVALDDPDLAELPIDSWLRIRPRQYTGPYPDYPHQMVPWHQQLSEAYAGQSLLKGRICPHQGTDLSGMEPDPEGIITCPLHGLQWRARTGKIVVPTRPESAASSPA